MLCDPMAVEQILENLLSNAIRFGPGRPVEVSLGSDGEAAQLSVRDEGVGISDCDQALIFERFHRSRQAKPTGGFGMGLWVTRQLVRAMRGRDPRFEQSGCRICIHRQIAAAAGWRQTCRLKNPTGQSSSA